MNRVIIYSENILIKGQEGMFLDLLRYYMAVYSDFDISSRENIPFGANITAGCFNYFKFC